MKNLFLLSFALLLFSHTVFADLGSCIIYQVKVYLQDGRSFNAYMEVSGYGPASWLDKTGSNEYCSDEGVFELFKKMQRERSHYNAMDGGAQKEADFGKLVLYQNIHYFSPKGIRTKPKRYNGEVTYGCVLPEDIIYVDSNEIAQTIFWQAIPSPRNWLTSEMLLTTRGMLDTIQHQQYWNETVVDLYTGNQDSIRFSAEGKEGEEVMWGYRLINYSARNNLAELKRLARLQFPIHVEEAIWDNLRQENNIEENATLPENLKRLGKERVEREYQKRKDWFWKRGIVMVQINGTC